MNCFKKTTEEINCQVCLLDGKELSVNVQGYAKGSDLLEKVFEHLKLAETDCFSLRYKDKNNVTQWLDPMESLNKQVQNISFLTLYFGVRFYLEDPCQLKEEVTRYQFFLQLKQDLLNGRIPCSDKIAAVLASLCVQSELGDYDSSRHTEGYISEFRFIPNQTEELERHVSELHKTLRGMAPSKAETKFLSRIQRLEMYGVDLHRVNHHQSQEYYIGLTPTGISIYQNKIKTAHYYWPKISRVDYKGRTFVIAVQRRNVGSDIEHSFQLDTKDACRRLWISCGEQHAFFRLPSFNSTTFRHSGRTKKEALELSSSLRRQQPKVERTQSQRFSRRLSALSSNTVEGDDIILRTGRDSPTSGFSTASLPWESSNQNNGGLYSSTNDVYESGRSRKRKPPSYPSRSYHSERSGDESESGFATRYRRNTSLTELSDAGIDENRGRRRRRRARKMSQGRGGETSGSEAENDGSWGRSGYRNDKSLVDTPETVIGNSSLMVSQSGGYTPQAHTLMKRSPANFQLALYQASDSRLPQANGDAAESSWYGDDTKHLSWYRGDSVHSSRYGDPPLERPQGPVSEERELAMQALQEELAKLGRRTAKVDPSKKMSLTPREVHRVSRLYGENHHVITEL